MTDGATTSAEPAVARRRKNRIVLALATLFFFGLPLVGILAPYLSAHSAMRQHGLEFAQEFFPKVLKTRDWNALYETGTLTLKNTLQEKDFNSWLVQGGTFENIEGLTVTRSWVSTRGDQGWQLVSLTGVAKFVQGRSKLEATVARRSIALDEWRVESFSLSPLSAE